MRLRAFTLLPALIFALFLSLGITESSISQEPLPAATPAVKEAVLSSGGIFDDTVESFKRLPVQAMLAAAPQQQPLPLFYSASRTVETWSSAFGDFASQVTTGQAGEVTGVYVEGVMELPVERQPETGTLYVTEKRGVVTLFERAEENGVTGLLAHNTLSGILFYNLQIGQDVRVVYGDGGFRTYRVASISQFQKLSPFNPFSNFIDLSSGKRLGSTDIFNRFYTGEHRVTFQTCLESNGDPNWGLTFIEAYPVEDAQVH